MYSNTQYSDNFHFSVPHLFEIVPICKLQTKVSRIACLVIVYMFNIWSNIYGLLNKKAVNLQLINLNLGFIIDNMYGKKLQTGLMSEMYNGTSVQERSCWRTNRFTNKVSAQILTRINTTGLLGHVVSYFVMWYTQFCFRLLWAELLHQK